MVPDPDSSDEALIARVAAGDPSALPPLVARHRGRVYHLALAITGDAGAAEDVLQETFLSAHRAAATFRGPSFRAWLYTIARHRACRVQRRRLPVPTEDDTLEALGEAAGWGAPDEPDAGALKAQLARALTTLDDDDREVLVLRELEERTGAETAAALGITLQAMKSRLHRARLRLAAALRGGPDGA